MHTVIRNVFKNALAIFIVSQIFDGLIIHGVLVSYLWAGLLLALFTIVLDPIVKVITLPFNILTLGLLSFLTTLVSLFVTTLFYHNVAVVGFVFRGFSLLGIHSSGIRVSGLLSYVAISATIYFTNKLIDLIFSKE